MLDLNFTDVTRYNIQGIWTFCVSFFLLVGEGFEMECANFEKIKGLLLFFLLSLYLAKVPLPHQTKLKL